ncbi:hypothetical protein ASD12_07970 [Mesorhizobium sp. Root102]|uniref:hypothetical protein n=1 Tax=Mesorhizobium sp. Root102 TaxID=1736422 RepID=UPI000701777B|nr:hypothetical protein [Mesorhizobium sp. Root102]KQU87459.1 hypothetical protein ASD12_07970 [Mesorhizobium sp. Root102]
MRRDLQHRTIVLLQAYDASVGASPWHRHAAERAWPAVVAAQRLAYRVLATCWSLENAGADAAPEKARTLFGPDGEKEINLALALLADAVRTGRKPEPLSQLPEFLSSEMRNLYDSLIYVGSPGAGPSD